MCYNINVIIISRKLKFYKENLHNVGAAERFTLNYFMVLEIETFIQKAIRDAHYEFDSSVKMWIGWLPYPRGIYAQGKTIEQVREDLISALEEYLLFSIQEKKKIEGFSLPRYVKAS